MKSTLTISWGKRPIDPIVAEGLLPGIELASTLGFDAVELNGDASDFDTAVLKPLLEQHGVTLSSIMTGAINGNVNSLSSSDLEAREVAQGAIERSIDVASEFGALVSLGLIVGSIDTSARPHFVSTVQRLCDYAAARGVKLCLEPVNRYFKTGVRTVSDALCLIDEIGRDNIGITLDVFQANIEELSIGQAIRDAGKKLFHVQLADNTRSSPGSGSIDFHKIREALKEVGYDGWLSAEMMPVPDSEKVARDWITFYREFTTMPPNLTLPQFEQHIDRLNADPVFRERCVDFNATVALEIDDTNWVFRFADGKIVNVMDKLPVGNADLHFKAPNSEWQKLFSGESHLIKAMNNYHGQMSVEGRPILMASNMRPLVYLFSSLKELGNA